MRIGPFETNAIAMKLGNVTPLRPMTHDLIRNTLGAFNSEIVKIEVMDLRDNTRSTIDSRPSDAIAVAVTTGSPIYLTEEVLLKTKAIQLGKDLEKDEFKEFLENLNPEDFKYTA